MRKTFIKQGYFGISCFLFVLMMEFGPNPFSDNRSLFIQVTSQKVIVTSILIYYFMIVIEGGSKIRKF